MASTSIKYNTFYYVFFYLSRDLKVLSKGASCSLQHLNSAVI